MAGDWIKIEHTTPDKPEVDAIARELGIDPDAATGKLIRLWIWADQQTISGNAASVTESLIDRITYQPGFSAALRKVGWLQARSGSLALPNFAQHNGQTAKARAVTSRRVSEHRRGRNASAVTDVTPGPLPKPLPEKRREEKKSANADSPLPPRGEPALPHGPAFADAWREWLEHLKQKRCNPTPLAKDRQLRKLAAMSEADAVAMIDASIGGNYQGLYPPKESGASQSRNGSRQAPRDLTRASDLLGETTIEP